MVSHAAHTFREVQQRDSYVAGFMHAVCGHEQDLTAHMFGSPDTYQAWRHGYRAGRGHHDTTWTQQTVSAAMESYRLWRTPVA
jgi:hypothetical protein